MGPFGLFDPEGRRIEVRSRKMMAMLGLLATGRDGARTRRDLQDTLWGSRAPAQAQNSLSRELHELNKLIAPHGPPLIGKGPSRVFLHRDVLETDLDEPGLGQAVFLDGIDLRGEDAFEDWLRQERAALDARRRTGAGTAATAAGDVAPMPAPEVRKRSSVAVLRFETSSPTGGETGLAEEIAEAVIDGLARSRMLSVGSARSSFALDPVGGDTRDMCARLNVDYLVQGHVRRRGDIVRISVFLVDGRHDRTIWSERYDMPAREIPQGQDGVVSAIISALEATLLGHHGVQSPPASRHWDLLLRGRRQFWKATFADWEAALGLLTEAHALDPEDVPTLYHLAFCHLGEVWVGAAADPQGNIREAHRLALRAVSNDPSDAFAHYVLGTALSMQGRFDQAEAEQRRALALNPHLAAALGELGRLCVFAGRLDEAMTLSDRAIAIGSQDPHLFLWFRSKALAAFIRGDLADAARHAADACASGPHQFFLHYLLTACHAAAGDARRASIALAEGQRLQPRYTEEMIRVAHPFADPAHLARYLEALRKAGWSGSVPQTLAGG